MQIDSYNIKAETWAPYGQVLQLTNIQANVQKLECLNVDSPYLNTPNKPRPIPGRVWTPSRVRGPLRGPNENSPRRHL